MKTRKRPKRKIKFLNYVEGERFRIWSFFRITAKLLDMEETIFIANKEDRNFFDSLAENLKNCTEFKMSVAFISWGGIQNFFPIFEELERKNIKGQILTTTYQDFTQPDVLEKLHSYKNIELKIYVPDSEEKGFHTKGYLFQQNNKWTIIIGSSNITHRALKTNQEWNLLQAEKMASKDNQPGDFAKTVLEEFNELWKSPFAAEYSDDFLIEYREYLIKSKEKNRQIREARKKNFFQYTKNKATEGKTEEQIIQPNRMQQEAIAKLTKLREIGATKALAVAATGSGKTYMAVFDVMQFKPKHMLFIVHRDNILHKACESFKEILMEDDSNFGFFNGSEKVANCKYVFASTNTLIKHYTEFNKDEFDYIVIDEAHHSTAPGNQKILKWFKPKFLLGLTATPDKMNGDVYSVFDNHVAVDIRLRDALKYELVSPFNYFALTDVKDVDYTKLKKKPNEDGYLDEVAKMLEIGSRVDYIIEKMQYYGHDGKKPKVLGFCANLQHAEYMAEEFNKRLGKGKAIYLNKDNDTEERQLFIDRLADDNDELSYIFTVDIFNEGVDIPSVNTVLMLRPTQSAIVFIQQLGRGLRKTDEKEFLTVLDFVGNYQKSFLLAVAFNDKANTNKRKLQKQVNENFRDLPNAVINMDPIIKEQILRQLEKQKFMTIATMSEEYFTFKRLHCDNKVPFLTDYLKPGLNIEPMNFCRIKIQKEKDDGSKKKSKQLVSSYLEFITQVDKENTQELIQMLKVKDFEQFINFIFTFLPAIRIDEWCILDKLMNSSTYSATRIELIEEMHKYVNVEHSNNLIHACEVLCGNHLDNGELPDYKRVICENNSDTISLNKNIVQLLSENSSSSIFKTWVKDIIRYAIVRYSEEFGNDDYGYPFLKLYHGYSQKEQALTSNYENSISAFRGNGLNTNCKSDYFIFVDLYKDENIREEINYKDKFLTPREFQWQSPNKSCQAKGTGYKVIHNIELGINLHLFVRKYKEIEGVSQPYIYLGKVNTHPESAEGDKPITMIFALENEVPHDLYEDFITNEKYVEKEEGEE